MPHRGCKGRTKEESLYFARMHFTMTWRADMFMRSLLCRAAQWLTLISPCGIAGGMHLCDLIDTYPFGL